jgi:uracil phosphoribosyltransferase
MKNVHISKHPLILEKLTHLRDKNTTHREFKPLIEEITMLLSYPVMADLKLKSKNITTPLNAFKGHQLEREITLVSILRAGLAMADGFAKVRPESRFAHIGMYRNEETLEPVSYYARFPSDFKNHVVVLADPMLATGGSALEAIEILKRKGVKDIVFMCIIASKRGIAALRKHHPKMKIYAAAVDDKLNSKGYIVPGLGDAGDRMFGTF